MPAPPQPGAPSTVRPMPAPQNRPIHSHIRHARVIADILFAMAALAIIAAVGIVVLWVIGAAMSDMGEEALLASMVPVGMAVASAIGPAILLFAICYTLRLLAIIAERAS